MSQTKKIYQTKFFSSTVDFGGVQVTFDENGESEVTEEQISHLKQYHEVFVLVTEDEAAENSELINAEGTSEDSNSQEEVGELEIQKTLTVKTKEELLEIAVQLGIQVDSRLNKGELIDLILKESSK